MSEIKKSKIGFGAIVSIAVLAAGLLLALLYIFTREIVVYNIDHTDSLFWAAASVKSGSLINYDYWYVYIIPFSGSLLMIPFVKALGVTYLAHELGMTAFVLVMAAAVLFGLRALGMSMKKCMALTGIMIIAMNISANTRVIFFGHVIHYSLAIVFTFTAFILLKGTDCLWAEKFNLKQRIYYLIFAIWCFLCCMNGSSAMLLYMIPLAGALVMDRLLDKKKITFTEIKIPLIRLGGLILAALMGFAYKRYRITPYFDSTYEERFSALLPHGQWMWKDQSFLVRFVTLLTGDVYADTPMLSGEGIFIMIRFVSGVLLLVIPAVALIFYRKYENRMMRILLLDYWVLFIVTYITYGLSVVSDTNWRLGTLYIMAVAVTFCFTDYLIGLEFIGRFANLAAAFLIITLLTIPLSVYKLPTDPMLNGYVRMAAVLDEHGLTYGYSDLWGGADVMDVITDQRIRMAMISYEKDGSYNIVRYQSEASGYEDRPGVSRYFAVVPDSKMDYVKDTLVKNSVEQIPFEDSTILVFEGNIFSDGRPIYVDE